MRAAVARVISAKTHYSVLEVEKDANDATIKKAYRKLALMLHPDKNTAPRAEEAFKKLSEAFNCLSDGNRRATYDQFGTESPETRMRRDYGEGNAGYHGGRDPTPEELFNQFFGNAFGGGGQEYGHNPFFRVYTNRGGYARPRRAERAEEPPSLLQQIGQLLPLLLILLFMFSGGSQDSSADGNGVFSLKPVGALTMERRSTHGVSYYVSPQFDHSYGARDKRRVEIEVEKRAKREAFYQCQAEMAEKERRSRATSDNAAKKRVYQTPHCDLYKKLAEAANDY
jgi:hypothetical protein